MPTPAEIGGTNWTRDGIEPARAFWEQVEAYRDALIELSRQIPDLKLRNEFLEILNKQAGALNGLSNAIHVLDSIGIKAKQERSTNGETSQAETE